MNKILLIEGINKEAKVFFESKGLAVEQLDSAATEEQIIQKGHISALGIRSRTHLKNSFFKKTDSLLAVGAFCIGVNQIDLESATSHGVAVFNSPYSNTRSVAELTLANIINLSRKITHLSYLAHSGKWKKTSQQSHEIRGKTLGIIGYGHIGSQISILAEALSMKVYYYDIQKKLSYGQAQPTSSLEEMLPLCDFVTLHVPQTPQTSNMITKKELSLMKEGSYLINTSRGNTVVLTDLVQALKKRHLAGAAIDVFPEEPASNQEQFTNELQNMENVILTPHIGGSTEEAQVGIARDVSKRLYDYLLFGESVGSVNFPQLSPPVLVEKENTLRIANVHKNVPGVLSKINNLISANVKAQYLSTTRDIGYLIMDIDAKKDSSQKILNDIQKLDTSIQTRLLS